MQFNRIKKYLKALGPGWITGASDDDPSGIGTYSYAGSRFGYGQVWSMLFTLPLMSAIQEMCARIGQVTGRGLAGVLRQHYSRPALYVCVSLLLCANVINIAADIGAMAAAMNMIAPAPFILWALFFTVLSLYLIICVPYALYAKYLKFLTLSLFLYVIAGFAVQQDWLLVLKSLLTPHIELTGEFMFALVAIFGTTISPYLFFWQASTEVEEEVGKGRTSIQKRKGATAEEITEMRVDVVSGMAFSNIIAFFIMITAAATLYRHGIVVETAEHAALALAPVAGPFASLLFTIGIIGTGLLAVPVLAGSASYAITEIFGWKSGLSKKWHQARHFYGIITIATLLGLLINLLGVDPIKMLIWTAVFNGTVAPILLTYIVRIGNNKKIMGNWVNGHVSRILGWTTVGVMGASAILMLILLRM